MLSDAGAFDGFARIKLIEGEVWAVNAIHSWHACTMIDLATDLTIAVRNLGNPCRVFGAGSVQISDESVPEPDTSIAEHHDDGVLPLAKLKRAIEISDSTSPADLGSKWRLDARAGVAEYWVVERETRIVHQIWNPVDQEYAECQRIAFGETVAAAILRGLTNPTDRLP